MKNKSLSDLIDNLKSELIWTLIAMGQVTVEFKWDGQEYSVEIKKEESKDG